AQCLKAARIDDDAVLLDEAPDARDFRNALGLGDGIPHLPVLYGAQLGEVLLHTADYVLVDPAHSGGVGSERRSNARRQSLRRGSEVFENAGASPIQVRAVLEDDIDERNAEKGKPAHHPRPGNAEHRGGQGIGDLVLDNLRRLSGIFGVDDHLNVGEIGNGIERHALKRVNTGESNEDGCQSDEENVARGPTDDGSDHFGDSCWVNPFSAARRLLSASIRKVAEVTTSSPSLTPSSAST